MVRRFSTSPGAGAGPGNKETGGHRNAVPLRMSGGVELMESDDRVRSRWSALQL